MILFFVIFFGLLTMRGLYLFAQHIDQQNYRPVGRMFGKLYTTARDCFEMEIPSFAQWTADHP